MPRGNFSYRNRLRRGSVRKRRPFDPSYLKKSKKLKRRKNPYKRFVGKG